MNLLDWSLVPNSLHVRKANTDQTQVTIVQMSQIVTKHNIEMMMELVV